MNFPPRPAETTEPTILRATNRLCMTVALSAGAVAFALAESLAVAAAPAIAVLVVVHAGTKNTQKLGESRPLDDAAAGGDA